MNPLASAAIGSILRWALTFAAGIFVQHGIWSQNDSERYTAAASMALLTLLWSLWQKYRTHLNILTALRLPAGSSQEKLAETVKRGL
jgi:hypothetical protein